MRNSTKPHDATLALALLKIIEAKELLNDESVRLNDWHTEDKHGLYDLSNRLTEIGREIQCKINNQ